MRLLSFVGLMLAVIPSADCCGAEDFVGHWALTIPSGAAGWLGVEEVDGKLNASLLWGGGSVKPLDSAVAEGGQLVLTRVQVQRGGANKGQRITETITATRRGDALQLVTEKSRPNGQRFGRAEFSGQLTKLPPRPDLSQVRFGEPIHLFNGRDLSGWRALSPDAAMGWTANDGVLSNRTQHGPGKRVAHTNIRTVQEFEDFRLTLEARTLKDSNSGVYLRGIYEIQIFESYGRPLDSHHMGALYSRITPSVAAEKPVGEWQTLEITLVDRHVTVVLNGKTIIDNQPAEGCTGGALWSDPNRPGPIYLQGNHSDIDFRNIVLRPVD